MNTFAVTHPAGRSVGRWALTLMMAALVSVPVAALTASRASAAPPPAVSFAPTNYLPGQDVESVASGDFNQDGYPDLVTNNGFQLQVLLAKSDGSGSFVTPALTQPALAATSLAVGDFNNDGVLDLVAANWLEDRITLYIGAGNGTFTASTETELDDGPYGVAVGDFNHDGNLDVATANTDNHDIGVLLGDGRGGLGPRTYFETGNSPISISATDVNGDGNLDLVTADSNRGSDVRHTVSVLLGNGAGGFGASNSYPVDRDPVSVAVGDLNGDGRPDLVTSNLSGNDVSVLLNQGGGLFGPAADFPVGATAGQVKLADLNGDGNLDVVVGLSMDPFGSVSNAVTVLLGDGSGALGAPVELLELTASPNVAVADFNRDGRPDIAAGGLDEFAVYLNTTAFPVTVTGPKVAIAYGSAVPALVPTYGGFIGGDTPASLTTKATCKTPATASSGPGVYPVTCSGAVDSKYSFTYAAGSVTITKAATTTTISVSPASPALNQAVTFTATVTRTAGPPVAGAANPTGTVSFFVDGSTVAAATVPVINGHAAFTTTLGGGGHTVTASYSGDGNYLASTSASASVVGGQCTTTITGKHSGLVVTSGTTCLVNAHITGGITVAKGALLDIENSTVSGSISAGSPAGLRICGSHTGSIGVNGATGFVLIGDPNEGCAANTIAGGLAATHNTGGLVIIDNHISGSLTATANSGAGPLPGQASPIISGNQH